MQSYDDRRSDTNVYNRSWFPKLPEYTALAEDINIDLDLVEATWQEKIKSMVRSAEDRHSQMPRFKPCVTLSLLGFIIVLSQIPYQSTALRKRHGGAFRLRLIVQFATTLDTRTFAPVSAVRLYLVNVEGHNALRLGAYGGAVVVRSSG